MDNCIFCKIVKGEIPAYKVYEDEKFMAFLDVFPENKAHTLVIPKEHYRWVYDVPQFAEYWNIALKVTTAIQKAMNPEYISYQTFGLEVPHAHIHIKPRYEKSEKISPIKGQIPKEEMQQIVDKIKLNLDVVLA